MRAAIWRAGTCPPHRGDIKIFWQNGLWLNFPEARFRRRQACGRVALSRMIGGACADVIAPSDIKPVLLSPVGVRGVTP
jgi:hypothetical protein